MGKIEQELVRDDVPAGARLATLFAWRSDLIELFELTDRYVAELTRLVEDAIPADQVDRSRLPSSDVVSIRA